MHFDPNRLPDHPDVVRGMNTGYPRGEPDDRDEREDEDDPFEPDDRYTIYVEEDE